jgi:glycosyltransferase involved in cell wall biosynthesis
MSIWAHTLVRNEERYLWYSVMSVINYVDKILIWDTGSDDSTCEIIERIKKMYPEKIDFRQFGVVDSNQFTVVRQKMLDGTSADWFIIVDGDEVWWEDSIKRLTTLIKKEGSKMDLLVSPYYNLVGDIFHYQEQSAGKYSFDRRSGHLSIRAINRNIPGLHFEKPYGHEGLYDKDGIPIQNRDSRHRNYLDTYYLHFTHMLRSGFRNFDNNVPMRQKKYKYELGEPFPKDFYYPEVFFQKIPDNTASPWINRSLGYLLISFFEYPLKFIKRKVGL